MRGIVVLFLGLSLVACKADPPPPVMATIPVFSLTDVQGKPFASDTLVGKPYVASFFFTSCSTICPLVMGGVRGTLAKAEAAGISLRAISITVDPDNDTPEKLKRYADQEGIKAPRWSLLTSDQATLEKVIVKGFMAYVGEREDLGGGLFDIGHEGRLMLIDSLGRLRGLYEVDEAGQEALVRDAKRL